MQYTAGSIFLKFLYSYVNDAEYPLLLYYDDVDVIIDVICITCCKATGMSAVGRAGSIVIVSSIGGYTPLSVSLSLGMVVF